MSIQIEVQDAHAQLLVDFYIKRLKTLREEIIEREKETKGINAIILKLKRGNSNQMLSLAPISASTLPEYSEKWTWVKKIQFAIEQQQRPLTTKEIVDTLAEFEPAFIFDRKRAVASISSVLSIKSGTDKDFLRFESESGDFAYGINNENAIEDVDDLNSIQIPTLSMNNIQDIGLPF